MTKKRQTDTTLGDAIQGAFEELETLGSELREWYDNLPDGLRDSRDDIDEAASVLEGLDCPDVPDGLGDIPMRVTEAVAGRRGPSRSGRRDNAVSALRTAHETLDAKIGETGPFEPVLRETLDELLSAIENAADEADGVEMPGMYR